MKILIIIAILAITSMCFAGEYIIQPTIPDINPGDGLFEPGSTFNPYIISDEYGQEVGTIQADIPDISHGDGLFEPGSFSNPYIIRTND